MNRTLFYLAAAAWLAAASFCLGQSAQPLEWIGELNALVSSTVPAADQGSDLAAIRRQIEVWIALHPDVSIPALAPAPAEPWNDAQLRTQMAALKDAAMEIVKSDPSRPFSAGLTVVNVTDAAAALSPLFDSIDRTEIQSHDALTVSQAIEYLPGVTLDHKSPRNQTGISIGGFDSRQVPLLIDGIPAYTPFDGYVDLTRYLTSEIAEVQVARGYSSALLGPNALGGVINLVTRQPSKKLEGEAFIGTGSGNLLNSGLDLGTRWRRFFLQGGLGWLQSDFFPLSGDWRPNPQQRGSDRVNSYQRDEQFHGRAAWTPRGEDSYAFSYATQRGRSGIPPYAGAAPVCPGGAAAVPYPCVTPKYWSWPEWNARSYYFNSTTGVGEKSSVKLRGFYEEFPNTMDMYDDATYTSMTKPSSGILRNADRSVGGAAEFSTRALNRNAIGVSLFLNETRHHEQTTTFTTSAAVTTPLQTDRDRQSSFAIEDAINAGHGLRLTVGVSADNLDGLEAQALNAAGTAVVPFSVTGICDAAGTGSFSSCTGHVWSYNPAAALSWSSARAGTLFVTFAGKTRFPTLKDRYSYKAGKAVPNPLLHPEHSQDWRAGYSRAFARGTVIQADFFHTDVRNEIENTFFLSPLCPSVGKGGAGACQQAVNASRELHEGADFTLRSTPLPKLTLDAGYTFVSRHISGASGLFPVGTPRHKTVASAALRLPKGATGMASIRYQSGAVGMSDNGLPLTAAKFATLDLGAIVPLAAGLRLETGVKNLLDRNYYYWEGFPEAGRTWYVTLRYRY